MVEIRLVDPEQTRPLRQLVLRPHQTLEELTHPGEQHPDTGAFGAFVADKMVGTVLVFPESRAGSPSVQPWRLVAMAVDPDYQRRGIGAALVDACLEYIVARGGDEVWCQGRTQVIDFYEALGFRPEGPEWVDEHTGPHYLLWRPATS